MKFKKFKKTRKLKMKITKMMMVFRKLNTYLTNLLKMMKLKKLKEMLLQQQLPLWNQHITKQQIKNHQKMRQPNWNNTKENIKHYQINMIRKKNNKTNFIKKSRLLETLWIVTIKSLTCNQEMITQSNQATKTRETLCFLLAIILPIQIFHFDPE